MGAVLLALSLATGALQIQTTGSACLLSAYDTQGVRRLALTVSTRERPDLALFDRQGRRWTP